MAISKKAFALAVAGVANFYNIVDEGAVQGADCTSAILAAIAKCNIYTGGVVMVPEGDWPHGELATDVLNTGGVRIMGVGKHKSKLVFVPTGNGQTGITVDRTSGGAVALDIYSGFQLSDIQLKTTDTSYDKTALKLVDIGESELQNVNIYGFTGTAKDCVGVHTLGRENLWARDMDITACVPLRLGKNPDLSTGYLSTDHFNFHNVYLRATGTPNALPSACVLIDDGAHVSNLSFTGSQAWVGGQYGLHWVMTGDTYAYCSSLQLHGVRTEGGTSSSAWSVRIEATSGTPLLNFVQSGCEWDTGRNGVKTRNVQHQTWNGTTAQQPSPRVVMDVGTAFSVDWMGVKTSSSAAAAGVVIDSSLNFAGAKAQAYGYPLPSTASWTRTTGAVYQERPERVMSAHKWYWGGTVADDATVNIPCNNGNDWEVAEIKVMACIEASNILEYGVWYSAPVTGLTAGIVKASGSTNTAVADTDAKLCVWNDGSPGAAVYVKNRLGGTAYVVIEVTGKRSVES